MTPAIYNFSNQYKGDSFDSTQFTVKDADTTLPIDLTGTSIRIQFRNVLSGPTIKTLTIGDGISMPSPSTGVFTMDEFIIDWAAGKYLYDIQFTFPTGNIKTYLTGGVTIISDVTI